jgi:hypothetical protein
MCVAGRGKILPALPEGLWASVLSELSIADRLIIINRMLQKAASFVKIK